MKQKILLFFSSIISQLTIILGISTVMIWMGNFNIVLKIVTLCLSVILLILNGIMGIMQNTIIEPILVDSLSSKNASLTKSSDSKSLLLQEKFFDDVLEYCKSIGLNPSISTVSGTAMIVNVKGQEIQNITPLTLPKGEALTEKNYNMYLEYMKEHIETEKLKLL